MHLMPNMYKIITWKANAKEIITLKCVWQQICTKSLIGRQMLRKSLLENACGTTYVQNRYFAGKCSGNHHLKMHLTPNMYKIVTVKANAKKLLLKNAFDAKYVQNCYLKASAEEIITFKCIWHQICTKSLLWRQMLRKSLLEHACGTTYVQDHYFEGKC